MQARKVVLTWESIYDITEIAEYVEENFGNAKTKWANPLHSFVKKPFFQDPQSND
ncbi:MAG: hypothetical protein FWE25_10300 [Lachnospiraceae bacterium]|nr:hypothetical protein [Lachnospiraceae bacterium]